MKLVMNHRIFSSAGVFSGAKLGLLVLSLAMATGCDLLDRGEAEPKKTPSEQPAKKSAEAPTSAKPSTSTAAPAIPSEAISYSFTDKSGAVSYKLATQGTTAELLDASGTSLAKFVISPTDVTIAGGGRVRGGQAKIKIEDAGGNLRFSLKHYDNGDYKLKDADEKMIFKAKAKGDDYYKLKGPSEEELFKVKKGPTKTELRDAAGETVMKTKAVLPSIALASMGIEEMKPAERFALLLRLKTLGVN